MILDQEKLRVEIISNCCEIFYFQDDKWSYHFDPKLQELITQLESGLQSVLQKGDQSAYHNAEFSGNIAGELRIQFPLFPCIT